MIRRSLPAALFLLALAGSGYLLCTAPGSRQSELQAQEAGKPPAQAAAFDRQKAQKEVESAASAYVEALNKGDVEALIACWAPDADYINESGQKISGRDAIAAQYMKAMPSLKGTKAVGKINSLKFLRPEVVLEDGALELTASDGTQETNRYAVVWVKVGDRWLISSARDMAAESDNLSSVAYGELRPLAWLVGDWQTEGNGATVQLTCRWAPNKSFLLMDYTVQVEGAEPVQVSQRLGYDAHNDMVRSWVFDSNGGFGEAYWERDGNSWLASASGILPDGGTGGATNTLQYVDEDHFTWQSVDRDIDGEPLADVEVKFVRRSDK